MAMGFYQLIGVEAGSSAARIRGAYGRALGQLARERRARVEARAPTDDLDLQRARLQEAWDVLSDPVRRRRYDAMLRWQTSDPKPMDPGPLWEDVSDALVHPAASVAAKLLRVTGGLPEIGPLRLAASGSTQDPATLVPHDDDVTSSMADDGHRSMDVIQLPTAASTPPNHTLQLVDGSPDSSDVLVLPVSREAAVRARYDDRRVLPPMDPTLPPEEEEPRLDHDEVAPLVASHGYSGALIRKVREALGLTLRQMSERTRISEVYLLAVEQEDHECLPARTFVRGYVREVARTLHLDPDVVVAGYMERRAGHVPDGR